MIKEDWILKNWAFLSGRRVKRIDRWSSLTDFLQDPDVPTTGKFYGTENFYAGQSVYGCITHKGSKRLCLRPYIPAPMPEEGIKAVFIDPKKYCFNDNDEIIGLDTLYESPIYIFID